MDTIDLGTHSLTMTGPGLVISGEDDDPVSAVLTDEQRADLAQIIRNTLLRESGHRVFGVVDGDMQWVAIRPAAPRVHDWILMAMTPSLVWYQWRPPSALDLVSVYTRPLSTYHRPSAADARDLTPYLVSTAEAVGVGIRDGSDTSRSPWAVVDLEFPRGWLHTDDHVTILSPLERS